MLHISIVLELHSQYSGDTMSSLKNYLRTLNLFGAPAGNEPESDHQQDNNLITTRICLSFSSIYYTRRSYSRYIGDGAHHPDHH